jgi:putative oxidoreductase
MHPSAGQRSAREALAVIRVAAATLMIIHGVFRATHEGYVSGFGGFLESKGIPMGVVLATAITAWEIVGGLLLVVGKWTRWIALVFALELTGGLVMVHAPEGWFVVGGGRNGMEFAAMLIVVMLALAWDGRNTSGHL